MANGFAVGVMATMHRGACVLSRRSFRPWGHAAAAIAVTVVITVFLRDALTGYSARVQVVGLVTALQCGLASITLAQWDGDASDEERVGRRLVALAFAGLGVMQLLRALAHSPLVGAVEPAILSRTPLSAGVATGFLIWSLSVPVLVFYIHEARARQALRTTVGDLHEALAEVKALRQLLPVCASCRRVRDVRNEWSTLETYLTQQAGVRVTHGLCPECVARLYPELIDPAKS